MIPLSQWLSFRKMCVFSDANSSSVSDSIASGTSIIVEMMFSLSPKKLQRIEASAALIDSGIVSLHYISPPPSSQIWGYLCLYQKYFWRTVIHSINLNNIPPNLLQNMLSAKQTTPQKSKMASFSPRLEQTTSSAPIFPKLRCWLGKCLKKSCSY
jgi:acyl CoA:acetate/3-ketoacid CoA transferase alpha subunit